MYAIISSGGKQYKVQEGDFLRVEKLEGQLGDTVEIDQVLLVKSDGGLEVGDPLVSNAKVTGTIVDEGKGRKVLVFKKKRRKQYRRKRGHRQLFTTLKIDSIAL